MQRVLQGGAWSTPKNSEIPLNKNEKLCELLEGVIQVTFLKEMCFFYLETPLGCISGVLVAHLEGGKSTPFNSAVGVDIPSPLYRPSVLL